MKKYALWAAWVIALLGCITSVFFREILHIEPCPLCWYQRMALFPLAILLGMGIYRGDRKIWIYALPFAVFGFIIAAYQVLGSYFPAILHKGLCGQTVHCSSSQYKLLGFLTLPMVSGIAFALILYSLLQAKKS